MQIEIGYVQKTTINTLEGKFCNTFHAVFSHDLINFIQTFCLIQKYVRS